MKFGIYLGLNLALRRYEPREAVKRIVAMGYDYAEPLHSSSLYTWDCLSRLKEAMAEFSLPVPCYSLCVDLLGEKGLQTVKEVADRAAFLGCRYLHHTLLPSLKEQAREEEVFPPVIKRLRESCAYAKEKGLQLLVEPQGLVFNGTERLQRLFEAMEGEGLGYCSDVGNGLFVDADPLELASAFASRTCHVHVKDYCYTPEGSYQSLGNRSFEEVMPGEGDLPLKEFLRLYKQKDLGISVEYDGPWERQEEALHRVKALAKEE